VFGPVVKRDGVAFMEDGDTKKTFDDYGDLYTHICNIPGCTIEKRAINGIAKKALTRLSAHNTAHRTGYSAVAVPEFVIRGKQYALASGTNVDEQLVLLLDPA
jgi:hypothetical protein